MSKNILKESGVLRYSTQERDNNTVRRYYAKWRNRNKLPERCDIPSCVFHAKPLSWNNMPLQLILDHQTGNKKDNSPQNLRYLCPNCDSQQPTHGGRNKGRIPASGELGYPVIHRDGRRDAHVFPKTVYIFQEIEIHMYKSKNDL